MVALLTKCNTYKGLNYGNKWCVFVHHCEMCTLLKLTFIALRSYYLSEIIMLV